MQPEYMEPQTGVGIFIAIAFVVSILTTWGIRASNRPQKSDVPVSMGHHYQRDVVFHDIMGL